MSNQLTVLTRPLELSQRTLVSLLLSFGYAIFVIFFPWDEISRGGFPDFDNYIDDFNYYYSTGSSRIDLYELSSVIEYFINEVLWNELIIGLHNMTGDSAIALRIVSFFILFVSSLFTLKHVGYRVAPLFLFNPSVIDVAMSGIRNGLAWTLVIIALWNGSKILRAGLFLVGMFIHSATLVLFFLNYYTKFSSYFIRGKAFLINGLGAGICVGLALTVFNELVLGTIGDRRSGEDYVVGGDSFRQASIWAILLYFQCTSGSAYIRKNIFVIALLVWYQIMNPFIPGSYRIWAALLPVVALSVMNLPVRKRQIFLYLYSGYLVLQYLYWTKLFYYWHAA
jgi:hypothetical protein